jgi:PST family polysaccharide transporter
MQAIVVNFAELGLSADLIRGGRIDERGPTATTVAVISAGVLAGVMVLLAGPISSGMGSPHAAPVVRVMALTLVLSALSVVPYAKIQRDFRQGAQLGIDATGLVVSTVITVVLVALGWGAMALAVARVIAQGAAVTVQFLVTHTKVRFGFHRELAKGLITFGFPLALANSLSWVVMNGGNIAVGALMGALSLGFYVLAFNISMWPMSAMGMAIRSVALPAFSALHSRRKGEALASAAGAVWAVALLAGILLSALANAIIPLVYGEVWLPAAAALGGLAFFGAIRVVIDLAQTFMVALGASRSVLLTQIVWIALLLPCAFVGIKLDGLAGAGWANVVVGVLVLPVFAVILRRLGVNLWILGRRLVVPLICAVPAAAVGLFVARLFENRVLDILVTGAVTGLVYAAPLVRWVPNRLRELRNAAASPPTVEIVAVELSLAERSPVIDDLAAPDAGAVPARRT